MNFAEIAAVLGVLICAVAVGWLAGVLVGRLAFDGIDSMLLSTAIGLFAGILLMGRELGIYFGLAFCCMLCWHSARAVYLREIKALQERNERLSDMLRY